MPKTHVIKGIVIGILFHAILLVITYHLLFAGGNYLQLPIGVFVIPVLYFGSFLLAFFLHKSENVLFRITSDAILFINGLLFLFLLYMGISQSIC
jgi:hypothetical protein